MPPRYFVTLVLITFLAEGAPSAQNASAKTEKLSGYAEWRRGEILIVDGQRVRVTAATKLKGKNIRTIDDIPLGYEISAKGARLPGGVMQAVELEAKPNGEAILEAVVRKATNEIEQRWVLTGEMCEPRDDGGKDVVGRMVDEGPRADRVRAIMNRLRPPYIADTRVRVHVVETKEWNAAAMGNGAIWVYTGLIDAMSDDELAIVLGHELAHYTHEHSRRAAKREAVALIVAASMTAAVDEIPTERASNVGSAVTFGLIVKLSNYSRDQEDQADRVGLRYAYEGGFDVAAGPRVFDRLRQKYGDGSKILNFLFGGHSRPSDRVRNLRRELAVNYPDALRCLDDKSSVLSSGDCR